ncbi:hypothetical protein N7468_009650 [Penicillium chermesinum]|uniref:Uncharacterized protein n=1 Tax=Penicillium chermesinum TaxID=63820 RepID=A0A9W9TF71_9EURO|nr:uncharacterized protein N7468_009650 [Penicillium chermesinum]KAJ5220446.1 hypothetical protein N7468_009650 [Penicillium chermesinum]
MKKCTLAIHHPVVLEDLPVRLEVETRESLGVADPEDGLVVVNPAVDSQVGDGPVVEVANQAVGGLGVVEVEDSPVVDNQVEGSPVVDNQVEGSQAEDNLAEDNLAEDNLAVDGPAVVDLVDHGPVEAPAEALPRFLITIEHKIIWS